MSALHKKALYHALIANFVWINISEIARYVWFVRPMLKREIGAETGPMEMSNLLIWAVWDVILIFFATLFFWLWFGRFGTKLVQVVLASIVLTLGVFGLLWLGAYNMGLVPASFLFIALPLAWFEQLVAALIVLLFLRKYQTGFG